MKKSVESDIATRIKSSALELFSHFSSAQIANSESKWRCRSIRNVTYFNAGGVAQWNFILCYQFILFVILQHEDNEYL